LGVGTNVLIARSLGKKDYDFANSVVSHSLIISTIVGVLVTIGMLLIAEPFFQRFTDDPEILELSISYMKIAAFMQVPNMVHISIQKIIQGTGNMLAPMWFQIAGVVLNIVLDPILIFGLFGFPALGVRGAAISTVAGYTLSMILAFYVLIFTKQRVKIQTKGFRTDFKIYRDIMVIGFPSLVMNALGAFMTFFANIFLVAYSTTAVAFFGAYFKIQQVVIMTVNGLIQGCIPIMSYCYGANLKKRLTQTLRSGTGIAILLLGVSIVLLFIFPEQILRVFMASDEMMGFGVPALRIMSSSYIFVGISTMVASFMQSTGRIKQSIIINVLRQLALLVPFMWILSRIIGMAGVWWAFVVAEVITVVVSWVFYKKSG
jgi:putative MATE family efflux protein